MEVLFLVLGGHLKRSLMLVLTECPNITDDLPLNIFFWASVVASYYITLPKNLTIFLIIYLSTGSSHVYHLVHTFTFFWVWVGLFAS